MDIQAAYQFFKSSFAEVVTRRLVGIEYEYPIVQLATGEGAPYAVVLTLYEELAARGWQLSRDGATNVVVEAKHPYQGKNGLSKSFHHTITTDAGLHTLEIGLAPTITLQESEQELRRLIALILEIIEPMGATLLGYGIQPITRPAREYLAARGRYRFLYEGYTTGADYVNDLVWYAAPNGEYSSTELAEYGIFTLSAAGQTHVDIARDEAIPVINALNMTSGLRIAMLANSPIWKGEVSTFKANRELFWEWGWHMRENQTGIPGRFQNLEHYLDFVFDFRGFMIQRDAQYYKMDTSRPFRAFFTSEAQAMIDLDGNAVDIAPRIEDVHFQCGMAWFTARLQSVYGTVEDRCPANQPPDSHMAASALAVGLVENHAELVAFADQFSHDQARTLRLAASKYGMMTTHPEIDVYAKVCDLLAIAQKGLQMRGHGEEVYLSTLQARVARHQCPADAALELYHQGGIAMLIDQLNMKRFLNDG